MQPPLKDKRRRQKITLPCPQITGETLSRVPESWLEELLLCVEVEGRHVEHILEL